MENNPNNQLSNKEQYELKRQEKLKKQNLAVQKQNLKRGLKITVVVLSIGGVLGGFIWYLATRPPIPEGEILSRSGIHWHPELAIYMKGVKQEIPANIGIGAIHQPIHTHDTTGVLHFEFQGLVRKQDITLGQFFKNWGKDMQSFGTDVKMTVNGRENTELVNYVMQDKDKIELRFDE